MKQTFVTSFRSLKYGVEEMRARTRMLDKAEHFVYCSAYFCRYNEFGKAFFFSIFSALSRGVYVCLIVDSFGQKISKNLMSNDEYESLFKVFEKIRKIGGDVIFYKSKNRIKSLLGAGYHIKIQLSDKGDAIFGSSNISANFIGTWREYSAYLRGDVVNVLFEDLLYLLPEKSEKHLEILKKSNISNIQKYVCSYLSFDPNKDVDEINKLTVFLQEKIKNSKYKIELSSFYFKPEPRTLKLLLEAAKRQVSINIYHSSRHALPTHLPWLPSLAIYKKLIKLGVNIYESKNGEHSKIIIVDEKVAVFGSYNFEWAAHEMLAESMICSAETYIIKELQKYLRNFHVTPSYKITRKTIRDLPLGLKLKSLVFKPI